MNGHVNIVLEAASDSDPVTNDKQMLITRAAIRTELTCSPTLHRVFISHTPLHQSSCMNAINSFTLEQQRRH